MKLGKLLAAGKSIMNGRTDVSYRSSKQIYLPKFGSPKNPFKNEPPGQTESGGSANGSATAHSDENGSVERRVLAEASPSSFARRETRREAAPIFRPSFPGSSPGSADQAKRTTDTVANSQFAIRNSQSASAAHSSYAPKPSIQQKKDKDWSKFNPLSILRAALPTHKAVHSENSGHGQRGMATQTELSLDAVKVVHNDLSDVDVEVVPIKSRASAPEQPRKSWEFVGERLFGVEAT